MTLDKEFNREDINVQLFIVENIKDITLALIENCTYEPNKWDIEDIGDSKKGEIQLKDECKEIALGNFQGEEVKLIFDEYAHIYYSLNEDLENGIYNLDTTMIKYDFKVTYIEILGYTFEINENQNQYIQISVNKDHRISA